MTFEVPLTFTTTLAPSTTQDVAIIVTHDLVIEEEEEEEDEDPSEAEIIQFDMTACPARGSQESSSSTESSALTMAVYGMTSIFGIISLLF